MKVTTSPFVRRLVRHYAVDQQDLAKLEQLKVRQVSCASGEDILGRGAEMKYLIFLASGWAIRYRYTPEGTRQIVHILVPGDIITPSVFVTKRTDHGITALSEAIVRYVDPREIQRLFAETRTLAAAFWWAAEQEHGMLREQIVRLGRRSALHRVAHLFLELHRRLYLVGLASEKRFVVPLTQVDIADVLGLSNVHINRTLKRLVAGSFISYEGSLIQLLDYQGLANLCDFDLVHFHLDSNIDTAISTGMA